MLLPLVAVNVAVFALWHVVSPYSLAGDLVAANFTVSVESIVHLRLWTLLTSEFSHVDPTHLLFNMLALWVFGRDVEQVIGPWRFLLVYLAGGITASVAYVAGAALVGSPAASLGASGAVMAIGVLFGAIFPRRTLFVSFVVPLPAAAAVALFVVLDVIGALGGGDNVAHTAHLGGAALGFAYWAIALRGRIRRD